MLLTLDKGLYALNEINRKLKVKELNTRRLGEEKLESFTALQHTPRRRR